MIFFEPQMTLIELIHTDFLLYNLVIMFKTKENQCKSVQSVPSVVNVF
jgi:hypothetical protein